MLIDDIDMYLHGFQWAVEAAPAFLPFAPTKLVSLELSIYITLLQ